MRLFKFLCTLEFPQEKIINQFTVTSFYKKQASENQLLDKYKEKR